MDEMVWLSPWDLFKIQLSDSGFKLKYPFRRIILVQCHHCNNISGLKEVIDINGVIAFCEPGKIIAV